MVELHQRPDLVGNAGHSEAAKAAQFKPGDKGHTDAAERGRYRARVIKHALRQELGQAADDGEAGDTKLMYLCRKLIDRANGKYSKKGMPDLQAAKLLFLYVDGYPETKLDTGGAPVMVNAITRTIVDPKTQPATIEGTATEVPNVG